MVMCSDVKEMVFCFSLSVACFICGLMYYRREDLGYSAFCVCAVIFYILGLVFFICYALGGA